MQPIQNKAELPNTWYSKDPAAWTIFWLIFTIRENGICCFTALCVWQSLKDTFLFLYRHRSQVYWSIGLPLILVVGYKVLPNQIPQLTLDNVIMEIIVAVSGLIIWILVGIVYMTVKLLHTPSRLYYSKVKELEAQIALLTKENQRLLHKEPPSINDIC